MRDILSKIANRFRLRRKKPEAQLPPNVVSLLPRLPVNDAPALEHNGSVVSFMPKHLQRTMQSVIAARNERLKLELKQSPLARRPPVQLHTNFSALVDASDASTIILSLGKGSTVRIPRELFEVALRMERAFVYHCGEFKIQATNHDGLRFRLTLHGWKTLLLTREDILKLVNKMEEIEPWRGVSGGPA